MKKVGITGGIGSGKSYICRQFGSNFGIITYYSDVRGKILMEKNSELRNLIINEFGQDSYIFENKHFNLNRDKFIKLLFDDESARKKMNSFVHPFVRKEFFEWCDFLIDDYYTLFESAILFDSEDKLKTDFNILVVSDMNIRIQRIKERNSISEEEIMKRISAQTSDEYKKQFADFIIENNGDNNQLEKDLNIIHNKIISL